MTVIQGRTQPGAPVATAVEDPSARPGWQLASHVLADMASGTLQLHSPRLAVTDRIRRGVVTARHPRRIARLAGADPAICAKLLRDAQADRRNAEAETITQLTDAVRGLGLTRSAGHVLRFAQDETFDHPEPALQRMATKAWTHAIRVSTLSYLLASLDGRFDPDQAALHGLLHNLGELALINRAARFKDPEIQQTVKPALRHFAAELGKEIANHWQLPEGIALVNAHLGNWAFGQDTEARIADLVIIGQWHSQLGQTGSRRPPPLHQVPAFSRLQLGNASPDFSLQLLEAVDAALGLSTTQGRSH